MKAIRSQSKLENRVSRELWQKGIRFRKNVKSLPGKPDIAIKKYKVVIFIDSCFWCLSFAWKYAEIKSGLLVEKIKEEPGKGQGNK
ncbi:hypothetical protein ACQCVP_08250 [Rossellomorea vietnamensis]|uniref:hypothetical protein n=1 Tax=Rossellomorea vietnamensis TaxID=218284 RepID=UPI003CF32BC0